MDTSPQDRSWQRREAERLLDDARASAQGGPGFGWLNEVGEVDRVHGRPLWITTRMTHCFALGHLLGREGDLELVDHGVRALLTPSGQGGYRDPEHDGWFAEPDSVTGKAAYPHAFVVLAGASATAAGHPRGAELLEAALAVQLAHFWDEDAGAVVEDWDAAWSLSEPYRGANANMHTVEAYLAAADVSGDSRWRHHALRICERMIDRGARGHDWRIPEHHDANWNVLLDYNIDAPAHPFRPFGTTPGHGLEWSRLLLHLDAALRAEHGETSAPVWLREAAVGLYDRAMADGWDRERGGLCYTTDWSGEPVVTEHFSWVVCEGIAAASALARVTGDHRFVDDEARMWDYAAAHYRADPTPGWRMEVAADGSPSEVTWQGRPDIYHAVQACLIPQAPLAPTLAAALAAASSS